MRLAIIKNNIVENVLAVIANNVADTIAHQETLGYLCVLDETAGPGDSYDAQSGTFTKPEPPAPPADPAEWLIDVGPFFDRFGGRKLPVLMSTDATVVAVLKDVQIRKWIDLQRTDVAQTLDLFISKGLITADDKAAILSTPVALTENLALKRMYFS